MASDPTNYHLQPASLDATDPDGSRCDQASGCRSERLRPMSSCRPSVTGAGAAKKLALGAEVIRGQWSFQRDLVGDRDGVEFLTAEFHVLNGQHFHVARHHVPAAVHAGVLRGVRHERREHIGLGLQRQNLRQQKAERLRNIKHRHVQMERIRAAPADGWWLLPACGELRYPHFPDRAGRVQRCCCPDRDQQRAIGVPDWCRWQRPWSARR